MKKNLIIGGVILVLILAIGFNIKNSYNSMVSKNEAVEGAWAQVESVYQRRADLIPNLVNTVKGYAEFEKSTFVEVTEARSKATSLTISADELTPENMAKFQAAQSQLSGSLSRLLATFERYPDLKANQNFLELQAQLEGTENRISVERQKFNTIVKDYNTYIKQFPRVLYANWFDFDKKGYFEADAGSENAPEVEF
ncbi:MAG: LemA family protein [Bacteroidetes bacterium]|nr:MAG: LemA family protein [Bacteroidota bacterium]MBL1144939.1 LemA family protein [Bacteroidota bacterium]NOG57733.1 LemA family protein [Bacteroidota bacterium]